MVTALPVFNQQFQPYLQSQHVHFQFTLPIQTIQTVTVIHTIHFLSYTTILPNIHGASSAKLTFHCTTIPLVISPLGRLIKSEVRHTIQSTNQQGQHEHGLLKAEVLPSTGK